MELPDRLSRLIERLAAGANLDAGDLRRAAALQALDLAKIGEDFAREAIRREREHTAHLVAVEAARLESRK